MSFRLQSNLSQVVSGLHRQVSRVVEETAIGIETHMKENIQEEKHGRAYSRGGVVHIASAPGEAPATDTGFLVNSISHEMTGETSAVIGAAAEYAPHLEFGTVHIAARPFMGPAFEAAKEDFEQALKELIK